MGEREFRQLSQQDAAERMVRMCQNVAPLGYNTILAIGDCLSLDNPEWPGQTSNRKFEVNGYTVDIAVTHDQNVPSGINVNISHDNIIVWYNKHEFYSVPEALKEFKKEMINNIRMAVNWIQNQ